ncbi:MAG: GNAT family N-acetyltransferase [Candidatus Xenobiia bacterium LiM19]
MKYTIRRAKADDIQKVIDLAVEMVVHSLSPYRETSREEIREFRRTDLAVLKNAERHENIGIFIAEDEEKRFIGHVIVVGGDVETSTGEKQGWVFDLSVKEEHWSSGIGKTLMLKAEEFVKGLGLKYLGMGVTTSNERAVRFYERCGYAEERKRMIKKFQA